MTAKNKRQPGGNTNRRLYLFFLLILIGDLGYIFLNKYNGKQISFEDFQLLYIGNLMTIIFFIFPAVALVYLFFKPGLMTKRRYYILFLIVILLNVPLLFFALSTRIEIILPLTNIFSYQIDKAYNLFLLLIHQFILIFFGFLLWLTIFRTERRIYFFSTFYSALTILMLIIFSIFYSSSLSTKSLFEYSKKDKADVAVILGAAVWSKDRPSPIFASRIGKATNLYNSGLVKKLQVTGGSAPGEISEAKVAYNLLINYGINPEDIWVEENTSSTYDQIAFVKNKLVRDRNLGKIIIVTDQFHLMRVMEICKFFNVNAEGISSDLKLSWEKSIFYRFRDSVALLLFWLFAF